MSKQAFKFCFFFKRIFKQRVAEPPTEIKQLFEHYSENGVMSVDNLLDFMIKYQKEMKATKEDAQEIFSSLKHLNIFQRRGLHFDAFFRYLLGDYNLPLPNKVHQDMDCPLAHYFLYTGHNSYLTGDQLTSDSSINPIINSLKRGVRVIELDLWPSDNNDVKVCHGGTLTAPVDFSKCLQAIKDHAFDASEYPVVITFEDHLPPNLQAQVAKMVRKTFGTMLYHPESENPEEFPSPNSLKRKVLISTKPPEIYPENQDPKGKGNAQMFKTLSKKDAPYYEKSHSMSESDIISKQHDQVDEGELIEEEDEDKAAPEYRKLIAIHATKLKGGLTKVLCSDQSKAKRLSMSEQQLENAINMHVSEIVRFTQRNLLRVYPKGTRILSTNYDPYVGWAHGAQMVAFNMQGTGKHLWIMQGMFRANGGCGYVKKPQFLLDGGLHHDFFYPNEPSQVLTHLKVKIYQGEGWHLDFGNTAFDQCSPPDFFIKLGIVGVPADTHKRKKSKTVMDQWAPVWNEEFTFPISVPELALLRIEVLDFDQTKQNDFAGQTCLPVAELRCGIRAVPLHDVKGNRYKHTRLLMGFHFD